MQTISENRNKKRDLKSKTEAQGLLHQTRTPPFICAFYSAFYLLGYTKSPSRSLQGSTLDVIEAYRRIRLVTDQIKQVRKKSREVFSQLFAKMTAMAKVSGEKMVIPHRCGRQTLRSNVQARTPVGYFRRVIFIPSLYNLLHQLLSRFGGVSEAVLLGLLLILAKPHAQTGQGLQK